MRRKRFFVGPVFEKAVTWLVTLAVVATNIPLVAIVCTVIGCFTPTTARAAALGTSTVSAGSAPPPAATKVDSFQPDLFTGRATTGVPIAIPPGRKGVQPSVGLGYSSSGRNGWLGVGWALDLGYIERSTRKGVPKYDATDSYAFSLNNVNSELVRLADGTYRARDEGGFLKIEDLGATGWMIRDKSGTRYLFGQSDASRVSSGTRVFRWHLDKVIDVNGNSMTLTYSKFDGLVYPATIDYTGHETLGTQPACRVNFLLESRPDIENSLRTGFQLKTSKRLAAIETFAKVGANLSLARRYELTYRQSARTGRSLLTTVRQLGTDGTTSLPPVTFGWQDAAPTYSKVTHNQSTGQVAWNVRGASYDCGHDNYGCVHPYSGGPCGPANYGAPVVVTGGTAQNLFGVNVAVGTDGNIRVTGNLHDRQIHVWTGVFMSSARTLSLPLAGGWDVCCLWVEDSSGVRGPIAPGNVSFAAGWSLIHMVAYNQNDNRTDGFGISGNIAGQVDVMSPTVLTQPQLAGDVDGNGITDIIDFNATTGAWGVYQANAGGIAPVSPWLGGFGGNSSAPVLGDWNGDGRTDIATYNNGSWRFATSSGSNFVADTLTPLTFGSGSPLTGDFNGDGIMDIGTYDFGIWRFATGTGSNFVTGFATNTSGNIYSSCRDILEQGASIGDGTYSIDPDGAGGQPPLVVEGLMSLAGGGWTKLTAAVAGSLLNTDSNSEREYLFVSGNKYYRTPVSRLVWSWNNGQGQDLYGTYYYGGSGQTEQSFQITASGEHTLYGVSASSGGGGTYKCLIYYDTGKDPNTASVQICQDQPHNFPSTCQAAVTVYIRETVARSLGASGVSGTAGQFSLGEPAALPSTQAAWRVRRAGWDRSNDNYGCESPENDLGGRYSAFQNISGSAQFSEVSVSVGGNGSLLVSGSRDNYVHSTVALYVRRAKTISLAPQGSWDVACAYVQDDGGPLRYIPYGSLGSVSLNAGWSLLHVVGYNQNQGYSYGFNNDIPSQVDVFRPEPAAVPTRNLQNLTGDFNGDGLTDIAIYEGNQLTVGLSDGSTFQVQAPITINGLPTNGVQSADFNGDGLSDLAYFDRSTGKLMVAYNTGSGFAAPVDLSPTLTFTQRTDQDQIQVADFNGDSLPDPAVFNSTTGDSELAMSQGGSSDLLVSIASGTGGSTAITYQPASSLGNNFLPFLTPVVTEIRSSDGLGNTYTNTYSYTGGFYDSVSKEFRGFARVDVRDAEANVASTYFNQDAIYKGRPSYSEFRDRNDRLYTRTINTWDSVQPYPGTDANFVRLIQTDSFTYDGTPDFKQTRSRMAYDAYGNVTDSYADGEVAVVGDERSSHTEYVLNPNDWILNRPALVQSRDKDGTVLAQRRFYYDNAGTTATPPTKGNLTKEEEWLDRDRTGPQDRWIATTMTYDGYGNVLTVTDALNHTVTNTYDPATATFLLQVSNPLGHTRSMVYDSRFGSVTSSTDANGVTTTSEYDALGRVTKVIGPLDTAVLPTTRYEYDLSSNPVRVTQYTRVQSGQAKELVSHSFSDGLGRTIQTRSPAQNLAKQVVTGTVEFDSKGRVVRQWTPYLDDTSTSYRPATLPAIAPLLAPPVVHTYDTLGRLLTTTDPDGSSTSIAYDHWTVTTTDAKLQMKRRTSDAFGRLVQVQEFQGTGTNATLYATTTYQYDARDNLVLLTDAVGNTTTLHYDSLNRKLQMTDPDMGTWTYAYDDVDKLAAQTDARGVSILFTYDSLNRQTRKDYLIPPASGVPTNQPPVLYTYDNPAKAFAKGKLTEIADASGSSSFAYDTLGRLVTEAKTVDGTTYTIQRAYDLLGRLTGLQYPNADVAAYTYNDQGGIQTIALQSPGQAVQPIINSVDYNAAGQITKMVYGNGVTTDYSYNPQTLRLQNLKSVGPGGVIQDFTYNFDAVGNVQSIADAVHTASQSFTYDSLNRLVTANGARYGNFTYAYNQVGNMTGKEGVTQNYGALNNRPHAVTSTSSGLALTYDANGNYASKTGPGRLPQVFTFDAENRLVEVNSPVPARRLDPGWNFVSFPQVTGEVPVASVITNFAGNCEQMTRLNASSNWFESFVNLPGTNQFGTVSAARGYALYVTNAAGMILPLGDTQAAPSPQVLAPGKHLLPGPAETMSVSNWLAGLVGGVDYADVRGLVSGTTNLAAVTTVRPGQAYYVTLLRTNTWTPPSAARIENPSTVRLVYDGDGGRVKKITSSGITLFLGSSYEVSPAGHSTIYLFAGSERVAAKQSDGPTRIYHSDHIGSANVITDFSGASVEVTENTPFGSISRREGAVNVAHKFTGQRLDDEIDLYFYNARYYDPEIGRFISPDSIIPNPSSAQDLNRYTYACNNPLAYVDPSGHKSFFKSWGSTLLQVVGIALAPLTGGTSLYLAYAGMAYSGYQAAQAGQLGAWAIGAGISLLTAGVNFANVGMQIAWNVTKGAATGAITAAVNGGDPGRGALFGAANSLASLAVGSLGIHDPILGGMLKGAASGVLHSAIVENGDSSMMWQNALGGALAGARAGFERGQTVELGLHSIIGGIGAASTTEPQRGQILRWQLAASSKAIAGFAGAAAGEALASKVFKGNKLARDSGYLLGGSVIRSITTYSESESHFELSSGFKLQHFDVHYEGQIFGAPFQGGVLYQREK